MKLKEQKIAQVVIGSGAAGFQSALRLYQNGEWDLTVVTENINAGTSRCEFPYKSRVMPTSEPLKTLKAPYMARNTMKWGFFRLKSQ